LKVMGLDDLKKALKEHLPARHHKLLPLNYQAIERGAKYIAK
jgi:2-oxoglutarate ferredoxin oxidoreductase subunit gamma